VRFFFSALPFPSFSPHPTLFFGRANSFVDSICSAPRIGFPGNRILDSSQARTLSSYFGTFDRSWHRLFTDPPQILFPLEQSAHAFFDDLHPSFSASFRDCTQPTSSFFPYAPRSFFPEGSSLPPSLARRVDSFFSLFIFPYNLCSHRQRAHSLLPFPRSPEMGPATDLPSNSLDPQDVNSV